VLVSSNPTNLVVAGGFSISFLVFSANLVLPVLASAVAVYPVLRWGLFRSATLIPPSISAHGLDPKAALVDRHGAIFGSALMLTTLMVLVGTSAAGLHVEVWMITVPAAVIMFVRDISHDISAHRRRSETKSKSSPSSPIDEHHSGDPVPREVGETPHENDAIELSVFPSTSIARKVTNGSVETIDTKTSTPKRSLPFNLSRRFPTPITTLRRLPYPLLPFAFSMFILVQGLASTGWIAVFAGWWAAWVRVSGLLGVVGGMGFVSVCLCNVSVLLRDVGRTINNSKGLRHKHWGHNFACAGHSSLGSPRSAVCSVTTWCNLHARDWFQLWRILHGIFRISGWTPLARYLAPQRNHRQALGVCQAESCSGVCCDVGGMQRFDRTDLRPTPNLA
jgi:hypothetical protein